MVDLGFGVGGADAGIRWGGAKVGIVGGHGGGICLWSVSWDSLAGTEQGLLDRHDDETCWRSQSWVLLVSTALIKDKSMET